MEDAFGDKARKHVFDYVKTRLEKTDRHITFSVDEVYIVWACYILGNWKVLISTTLPDQMYYEVTFDNTRQKVYIDAYRKWENIEISEGEDTDGDADAASATDTRGA
jgi:hypothetical protein